MPPTPAPNRERVDRFAWNRHYFHHPTRLFRWRKQLSILAIVIAGGWLALGYTMPKESRQYRYTHGDVANPHSAWNQRCDSCHTSFSMSELGADKLLDVHARWHDFRCEACHHGSERDPKNYAPHHADAFLKTGSVTDCGICHREHQGGNFSLVKLPDRDCTQCHRDLKEHHATAKTAFNNSIGQFAETGRRDSHPEFRAFIGKDPIKSERTLHFNHALHMRKGLVPKTAVGKETNADWMIGKIDPKFQDRYRQPGQLDCEPVQLACASCHQLDASPLLGVSRSRENAQPLTFESERETRSDVRETRSNGASMLPINFDNHCRACHPLKTGPVELKERNLRFDSENVAHRLQPKEIRDYLKMTYIARLAESKAAPTTSPEPKGRDRLDSRVDDQLKQLRNYPDVADELVEQAIAQLALRMPPEIGRFGGTSCGKCHKSASDDPKSLRIVPPNSPALWYPRAKFNHASHGAMTCASCHPANCLNEERSLPETLDLPGIDNCRQCHAPPHRVEIDGRVEQRGGVRHGCVDCHRYHSPAKPQAGLQINALDFLRGARSSSNRESP